MELLLSNLAHGFGVALSFQNLTFALLGALLAQTVFHVPREVSLLLDRIDTFVCSSKTCTI